MTKSDVLELKGLLWLCLAFLADAHGTNEYVVLGACVFGAVYVLMATWLALVEAK